MASILNTTPPLTDYDIDKMMEDLVASPSNKLTRAMMGDISPWVAPNPSVMGVAGRGLSSGGAVPVQYPSAEATQSRVPNRWDESNLQKMLSSRFGWDIDGYCPFRRIVPYKVSDEKIVVFIVTKDEALIFEDDARMYPSDTLMTQLRLLAEALK